MVVRDPGCETHSFDKDSKYYLLIIYYLFMVVRDPGCETHSALLSTKWVGRHPRGLGLNP